jgi:hypothetical protein
MLPWSVYARIILTSVRNRLRLRAAPHFEVRSAKVGNFVKLHNAVLAREFYVPLIVERSAFSKFELPGTEGQPTGPFFWHKGVDVSVVEIKREDIVTSLSRL